MMSLFMRMFIKNNEDVSNPSVKKDVPHKESLCYLIKCCRYPAESVFVYGENSDWLIKPFCCHFSRRI